MGDLVLLANFHFLRPVWFVILIPFMVATFVLWRASDAGRRLQPIFAPHLLKKNDGTWQSTAVCLAVVDIGRSHALGRGCIGRPVMDAR